MLQARVSDLSQAFVDAHGCPACPHPCIGPATKGETTVLVNMLPAVRLTDTGVHAACCGPNMWNAISGSATVLIGFLPAHRMNDQDLHCGGPGMMIQGSPNVITGG